ncbi:MAG: dipeptidase [Planctomycetaceae bacterium]|nr:dipeptidase [Planctomycetaceae bacterium]
MSNFAQLDAYLAKNQDAHLEMLFELLRIPSVSADSSKKSEMDRAANWVADKFRTAGLKTELIPGDGPALVYAETEPVPGQPVVLVYGHYDVQPADPLDLWKTPPFEPSLRDGNIYARGSTDDKGQMLTHVLSILSWKACGMKLPLQVKFLIEGQEEQGSEVLGAKLPEIAKKLACDVIVISDSSQYAKGQPAITYGLRGIAYFELRVHGPKMDLHSGSFGGAVTNPGLALARILTEIKTPDGRIQLPGFYDSVVDLEDSERQMWASLGFSDAKFAEQLGVDALTGESGYTTLERRWARPTFDVHGLLGGYQGEGGKTVIPSWNGAKISFRLVPNQDPETVAKQLRQFIASHTPPGVQVEVIDLHGGRGVVVDPNSKFMKGAVAAVEEGFGVKPVLIREGGSIPIVAQMVDALDCDVLLIGWGLDDDGAHSPNEKFCLADFYRGIRASSRLWQHLAD